MGRVLNESVLLELWKYLKIEKKGRCFKSNWPNPPFQESSCESESYPLIEYIINGTVIK